MTIMLITIADQTQPLQEWALDYGIPCRIIRARLDRGWDHERAITTPMVKGANVKLTAEDMRDEPPATTLAQARRVVVQVERDRQRGVRIAYKYEHDGLSLTIRQWADRIGISVQAMHYRLNRMSGDEAFASPTDRYRSHRYPGGASNTFEKA